MSVSASLPSDPSADLDPVSRRRTLVWCGVVCLTVLLTRTAALVRPALILDDFQLLAQSWTWETAIDNLWVPANEHSMPLGRLSTWLMVRLGGRMSDVARLFVLQGPLAAAAATLLVYLLVRRATGQPFPALLAMTLFGVSTHYWEAVAWFAASFALLGVVMLLLGLLAAQRWRQTGRVGPLLLSAVWCGLAPGWFGTGMLAGPLCTLFLLGPAPGLVERRRWRWLLALVPCLGTAVSLAVTLPKNLERILKLPRVDLNKTAVETFSVPTGAVYTLRATVDDVIPGALGIDHVTTPVPWVWLCLGVLAGAGVWWWRTAPRRDLLLLGLGMIVSNYLLIFTARAYIAYKDVHFSRYQLYPHLGLTLIVGGGWPRRWYPASLAAIPRWAAAAFLGAVLLTQSGRNWCFAADPQQVEDFRRIEEIDARCRRFHIDAATARQALTEEFLVYGCTADQKVNGRTVSGWDFLRGSDSPRPLPVEQARRLLDLSREP